MIPAPTLLYNAFWGVDPPSPGRRLRRQFYYWLPFACMIVLWVLVAAAISGGSISDEDVLISMCFALMILALGMHGLRLCVTDDLRKFRTNWADLCLAGVSPRDYLWSYARLRFSSGIFLSILATLCFLAICSIHPRWLNDDDFWVIAPSLLIDPIFLLTGGILVDVASWTKPGRFYGRVAALGTMLLIGPFCLVILAILTMEILRMATPSEKLVCGIIGPLLIPAIILRIWFIRRTWKNAIARLDGELALPFL